MMFFYSQFKNTYIENQFEHLSVGEGRPTLDMLRSRYSSVKAKRNNGSNVMQRIAMFSMKSKSD